MTMMRRLFAGASVLLLLAIGWMWWTRPGTAEMSAYAPADALIYLEAQDLPEIAHALASTEAMRSVPPEAKRGLDWAGTRWLRELVSFTGLGTHRAVILARAQVAVAVLGFEAQEEAESASLRFSPRVALVSETHTPEWRVKPAVEQLAGDLARRSYNSASVERKEIDGVSYVTWVSPADARRRIVTAVSGSVAVVGNDEEAVRACLEVRNGARQSLAGDEHLGGMRARVGADGGALAFGYAPRGSAAKVVEMLAPAFVGGVAEESKVQSLLATMLPQVVNQVVGDVGWSARLVEGQIEDHYFVSLPEGVPQRLRGPFTPFTEWGEGGAAVLPPDTYQFTQYSFRSPELAWRGLNATLSSQFDVTRGPIITLALEALAKPYGVEQPREFLRAVGPEVVTARLTKESERRVLVVEAFDRGALLAQARKHLGPRPAVEKAGDAELLVSNDPDLGAAALVSGRLVMGSTADVRRCVGAAAGNRALRDGEQFKLLERRIFTGPAFTRTLSAEGDATAVVVSLLTGGRRGGAGRSADAEGAGRDEVAYSLSETRLADDGFEKKTRSPFGLFGELIRRAAQRA